jgi:hypothetical protein
MKHVSAIVMLGDSELLGLDIVAVLMVLGVLKECSATISGSGGQISIAVVGRKIQHFPGSVHLFLWQCYFYLTSFPRDLIIC